LDELLGFVGAFIAPAIQAQTAAIVQGNMLQFLGERGVSVDPDTGNISFSEELLESIRPKVPLPPTTTLSTDLSQFREPPPAPAPELDLDVPMTRREVVALVQRLQSGQSPPPYSQAPAPAYPSFRSEAVLSVLESQIRDAWRRRGRA
jgi:hypothetical protein